MATASEVSPLPAVLQADIETERRRADVVGVAVAGFDRDGVRFAGGLGYADRTRGERVTADTLFHAASITKLITTTLILQEVEAATISLDDPVNRYLEPPFRIRDARGSPVAATIRHLLTHTAGLPVSWRGFEIDHPLLVRLWNGRKIPRSLEEVVRGMRTIRPPGKLIIYSNGGFCLLGYLAARLNSRPFEELVRERVFEPLEMARSTLHVDAPRQGIATPYGGTVMGSAGRRPAPRCKKDWRTPASALVTTASELSRFGQMILRGGELGGRRVLADQSLRHAFQFHATNHPALDEGYGLGFLVAHYRGRLLVGHDGGLPGVATRIVLLPDDGVGVTVLTNGGDPAFVHRVAERSLEMLAQLEPEAFPGAPRGIPQESVPQWKSFTERVAGRYRLVNFTPPGIYSLALRMISRPRLSEVANGVLVLEGTGLEPAYLYPDGEVGRYRIAFPMANGRRAVIEERPSGTHVWLSILHFFRPK
jgi:CubicO group peptidase (beta-lactamase class C family)